MSLPAGTIFSVSKNYTITVYNDEGKTVGELDFSGDNIKFEGSMDDTADRLFSYLKKIIIPFFKE